MKTAIKNLSQFTTRVMNDQMDFADFMTITAAIMAAAIVFATSITI